MLEASSKNELVVRLNGVGLYPDEMRRDFVAMLIEYCISGQDPAVLWDERLASMLTEEERSTLMRRLHQELLADLPKAVFRCTEGWVLDGDAESIIQPLRDLARWLREQNAEDLGMLEKAARLDLLIDEWLAEHDDDVTRHDSTWQASSSPAPLKGGIDSNERSVFEDLLEGRASPGRTA